MKEKHQGFLSQLGIYLGKYLRMFIFQNDWKVLPMGAVIAAVVTLVVGGNIFVNQEGTLTGSFALVSSTAQISKILKKNKIIKYPTFFKLYSKCFY